MASVVAVCISERKGAQKHEVPEIQLRQYRIMEQVLSPKDFVPRESVEKAGILDVFPFFHTAQLGQKIRRKPQSPLCGVALRIDHGIVGDAHAGSWHRQVSLLAQESVEKMKAVFPDIPVGAFAENILTEG